MFRILCDPSSGSIELYLTEIRSGSLMFVVCLIGVWQRNFEPVVCVYGTTVWELLITDVNDAWSCTSTPPYACKDWCFIKRRDIVR